MKLVSFRVDVEVSPSHDSVATFANRVHRSLAATVEAGVFILRPSIEVCGSEEGWELRI